MCFSSAGSKGSTPQAGPSYTCSSLNDSTYLVVHNDKYFEFPFIYVKLYRDYRLAVVIDTGCGAHNGKDGSPVLDLRDFIEKNILEGSRDVSFMVICTHCHFDHIGGIEAFSNSGAAIVASAYDRTFLDSQNREKHSLCGAFGTRTPQYEITQYANDGQRLEYDGHDLGLRILHTPGHTPDSMAIYDDAERWIYVGDTCYQRIASMPWGEQQDVPIFLPLQGNWKDFIASLRKLHGFVQDIDRGAARDGSTRQIQLAAGHTTSHTLAVEFLQKTLSFCEDVAAGKVPVLAKFPGDSVAPGGTLGDAIFVLWQGEGITDFALMAPESFQDDF